VATSAMPASRDALSSCLWPFSHSGLHSRAFLDFPLYAPRLLGQSRLGLLVLRDLLPAVVWCASSTCRRRMPIQPAAIASTTSNVPAASSARFKVHQAGRCKITQIRQRPTSSLKEGHTPPPARCTGSAQPGTHPSRAPWSPAQPSERITLRRQECLETFGPLAAPARSVAQRLLPQEHRLKAHERGRPRPPPAMSSTLALTGATELVLLTLRTSNLGQDRRASPRFRKADHLQVIAAL